MGPLNVIKALLLLFGLLFFGFIAFLACVFAKLTGPLFPNLPSKLNLIFIKPFGAWTRRVVGIKQIILNEDRLHLHRPMIFFGNHQSALDLAIIGSVCTEGAVVIGKKEIKNIPLFGWYWKAAGNLLLDRGNPTTARAQMEAIRNELISKRLNLAVFPEGTRSKSGEILPFKRGVFHMAASTRLPMVPVVCSRMKGKAIWENFELKGGHVIISVLEPIDTTNLDMNDLSKVSDEMRNKIIVEYDRINLLAEEYDRNPNQKKEASCC